MSHEIHLETVMIVNDGVARTLDYVTEHGVTIQLTWLARILRTHNAVNTAGARAKWPGARAGSPRSAPRSPSVLPVAGTGM
jgi:hypothetical protein